MDNETAKDLYGVYDIPQPTILVNQSAPRERDYWLKLYAGRALGGLCANPNITAYSDLNDRESPDNQDVIEFAKFRAQKLVNEMFKDES